MKWTQAHDQHLVREILAERPFDHQKGSRQIGTVWQTIVDNLNSKTEISFNLTSIRSVRERYGLLESKYKKTVSNELKQSGINTEPTEFDLAMEDIVSQFESQEETALKAKEAKEAEYVKLVVNDFEKLTPWTSKVRYETVWYYYTLKFYAVDSFVAIINNFLMFSWSAYWTNRAIYKAKTIFQGGPFSVNSIIN